MAWGLYAFLSGLLFAAGLGISGMTQPAKVKAFLDVAGAWDPSLLFVMAGGIGVTAILYRVVFRRAFPWEAPRFQMPTSRNIDAPLIVGAVLFGIGWGLVGYCPGPAVVSLAALDPGVWIFAAAMMAGMFLFDQRRRG